MEKVIARTALHAPSRDREYWMSRPPEERIAAVEELRQQWIAQHPEVETRLQRVCRIVQLHEL